MNKPTHNTQFSTAMGLSSISEGNCNSDNKWDEILIFLGSSGDKHSFKTCINYLKK